MLTKHLARTVLLMLGVLATCATAWAMEQAKEPKNATVQLVFRYVVVHSPGPKWRAGVSPFEQPGLQAHIDYYRQLLVAHKLAMGGPFLDAAAGGMMIPEANVPEAEIRKYAANDPAVKSGLLIFEVRKWLPAMHN